MSTLVPTAPKRRVAATMTVDGVTYPITLAPRGITRRKDGHLRFPAAPRRAHRARRRRGRCSPAQHHLKLVTHCKRSPRLPAEGAARIFRLPALQSDHSAELPGPPRQHRLSSTPTAAPTSPRRLFPRGLRSTSPSATAWSRPHIARPDPGRAARSRAQRARFAVFEYMISNYDWSMRAGAGGRGLLPQCAAAAATARRAPVTGPVRFRLFGAGRRALRRRRRKAFRSAASAQRIYRGYCAHMSQAARLRGAASARRRADSRRASRRSPASIPDEQAQGRGLPQGFFNDLDSGASLQELHQLGFLLDPMTGGRRIIDAVIIGEEALHPLALAIFGDPQHREAIVERDADHRRELDRADPGAEARCRRRAG